MVQILKLPALPTVQELIRLYGLSARQELSQNFLLDLNLTKRIARECGDVRNCTIVEVGSGPGSLTRSLLELGAAKVVAVEKDSRFLPALEYLRESAEGRLEIVHGDMLRIDEEELLEKAGATRTDWEAPDCKVRLLGNLPFAVATPLLLKWLAQITEKRGLFSFGRVPMVLMFQKEVADRITAGSGSRVYGRLSVMSNHACQTKPCFVVHSKAFVPPPKVDAGVVRFDPLVSIPHPVPSFEVLEKVVRVVFNQRRKQLRNATYGLGVDVEELLRRTGLDRHRRPESLTLKEWSELTCHFAALPLVDRSLEQ